MFTTHSPPATRPFVMFKLIFVFVVGIAYAAQTRIKIGSQSWGYQIELNQGQNIRTEFGNDEGVAAGSYVFKAGNDTKKLEYRIDPNQMEPDISFNVVNLPSNITDGNSTQSNLISNSTDDSTLPNQFQSSNMTFDSIDSKQDFKGHVTLKVGNSTYNINFVTGDKSHTREETLSPSGMMLGRFSYTLKNTSTKLVINYKFNSTSSDPTFEVSLYKTIEASETPSGLHSSSLSNYQPSRDSRERDNYSRQLGYPRNVVPPSYHSQQHHQQANSINQSGASVPAVPYRPQSYPYSEKYRDRSSSQANQPNWYYNRGKPVYDP